MLEIFSKSIKERFEHRLLLRESGLVEIKTV